MKRSVGEQVKAFREAQGWSVARMAREAKTTRQNIEHLEARPALQPRYIDRLARVMGTSVETLLAGRYEVNRGALDASLGSPRVEARGGPSLLEFSPEALQLAALFDRLPGDIVLRAKAWNAASAIILSTLIPAPGVDAAEAGRTPQSTQLPKQVGSGQTKAG